MHWVFAAALGLSLVVESGDSVVAVHRLLVAGGFSCCRAQALGTQASAAAAHGLSCSAASGIFPDQE